MLPKNEKVKLKIELIDQWNDRTYMEKEFDYQFSPSHIDQIVYEFATFLMALGFSEENVKEYLTCSLLE